MSWRLAGSWPWVSTGLICLTVADAAYSLTAADVVSHDGPYDFLWSAGALAFVQPSRYESFSIVALEAMAQGTPIVVNGHCDALAEHVVASGCGSAYRDRGEFDAAIDALVSMPPGARDDQARRARAYVASRYTREQVRRRLAEEIAAVIDAA